MNDPALAQAVLSSQGASLELPNGVVVGEHDARRIQLLGDRLVSGVPEQVSPATMSCPALWEGPDICALEPTEVGLGRWMLA